MRSPGHDRRFLRRAPVALVCTIALGASTLASGCTTTVTSAGPEPAAVAGERDVGGASAGASVRSAIAPAEMPRTVAMVGDSITVASQDEVRVRLEDLGLDVVAIDAQVGRRMTVGERDRLRAGTSVVTEIVGDHDPELWIVALGTNDIGQYSDADELSEQVRALLDRIPDGVPVVWVDTWFRDRPERTAAVNEAIRSVLRTRPDTSVVAWSERAPLEGVLTGDGVHLTTGLGVQLFADTVAAGVLAHFTG